MRWRRIPPVSSPVVATSLLAGQASVLGLIDPAPDALSAELRRAFAADEAILMASGTMALTLALRAVVPEGGVVAMPAYACIDIITAAIGARVRVILYDVDPETLSPDIASVREALSIARTLVVAPLYGYPVDMPGLQLCVDEVGGVLIEDAAQNAGATYMGRRVGSFGALTVLSFGRGKGMTGGSGGALLVRRDDIAGNIHRLQPEIAESDRGMRDVAVLAAQWVFGRPSLYAIPASIPALGLGEMVYKPPRPPARMSRAATAMLRAALVRDSDEVAARRTRAHRLTAAAMESDRFAPVRVLDGAEAGYLRLAVLDRTGTARAQANVGALRGYPITLDQHVETRRVLMPGQRQMAGATRLRDNLFTLPTHSMVSEGDAARIEAWLNGARV